MDKKFVYDKLASLNLSNLQKNEIYNLVNEVSKNSGGNSGNTAEPNIIYETNLKLFNVTAIQPKEEVGENLIKKDNIDNPFVKLNLMLDEDVKFKTILIPLQHTVIMSGEGATINTFSGKYEEVYNAGIQFKLGIGISIGCLEQGDFIKIEPLKVNAVYIRVDDLYTLNERTQSIDTSFIANLKMNQFSDIYLTDRDHNIVVKLSNIIYSGREYELNNYDTDWITGTYVIHKYLYQVEIRAFSITNLTITIKTYQLTPTT